MRLALIGDIDHAGTLELAECPANGLDREAKGVGDILAIRGHRARTSSSAPKEVPNMLLRAPTTGHAKGWEDLLAAGLRASFTNIIGSPECFEQMQLERLKAQKTFRKST